MQSAVEPRYRKSSTTSFLSFFPSWKLKLLWPLSSAPCAPVTCHTLSHFQTPQITFQGDLSSDKALQRCVSPVKSVCRFYFLCSRCPVVLRCQRKNDGVVPSSHAAVCHTQVTNTCIPTSYIFIRIRLNDEQHSSFSFSFFLTPTLRKCVILSFCSQFSSAITSSLLAKKQTNIKRKSGKRSMFLFRTHKGRLWYLH